MLNLGTKLTTLHHLMLLALAINTTATNVYILQKVPISNEKMLSHDNPWDCFV